MNKENVIKQNWYFFRESTLQHISLFFYFLMFYFSFLSFMCNSTTFAIKNTERLLDDEISIEVSLEKCECFHSFTLLKDNFGQTSCKYVIFEAMTF